MTQLSQNGVHISLINPVTTVIQHNIRYILCYINNKFLNWLIDVSPTWAIIYAMSEYSSRKLRTRTTMCYWIGRSSNDSILRGQRSNWLARIVFSGKSPQCSKGVHTYWYIRYRSNVILSPLMTKPFNVNLFLFSAVYYISLKYLIVSYLCNFLLLYCLTAPVNRCIPI